MNHACIRSIAPCLEKVLPCLAPERVEGVVFEIQKFTVHDGPGIRTELFLKGCPLRCRWCGNPESFQPQTQVGVYESQCIGVENCGFCLAACSKSALTVRDGKVVAIDRQRCDNCLKCQQLCPSSALKAWGYGMSVEEVMKLVEADRPYYDKSGGGVTISGGESLYQWQFTEAILKCCKEQGIHTCVETALHVKSSVIDRILPLTDLFITDIKQMDDAIHKTYTGVGNQLILENIKKIALSGKPLVVRIPIIPDVNDTEENIDRVGDFLLQELQNKVVQVQFLRFRRLGEEKYQSLGLPYQMSQVDPVREEFEARIKTLVKRLADRGIPAFAGTTHKIVL